MPRKRVQWDRFELAEMIKGIDSDRKKGLSLRKAAKKQAAFYRHPVKGVEGAYYRYRSRGPELEGAAEPEMNEELLAAVPRDTPVKYVAKDIETLAAQLKEDGLDLENFYVIKGKRVLVECQVKKTYSLKK